MSPLVMCKRIHCEQNVLLCTRGRISQGIDCAGLGVSPALRAVMDLGLLCDSRAQEPAGRAAVPECLQLSLPQSPAVLFLQPCKYP